MDGKRQLSIQVKSLSKRNAVPLGNDLNKVMGNFWIIVNDAVSEKPNAYILLPDEVTALAHRREKDGRVSYWLHPKKYAVEAFFEQWERIGSGLE